MPGEGLVRRDVDLDVEVAGRAAAGTDLALVGQLHAGAGVDAGRDLHGQGAARTDPAVTRALAARVGDDRAEAAAGRARAQGPDLAEERALHVRHLARAAAGLAGLRVGAGGRALAVRRSSRRTAVSTLSSRVTPKAASASSTSSRISASWPRRVRGRGPRVCPPGWPPKKASMMSVNEKPAPWPKPPPMPPNGVAAAVVRRALLRVGEDLVGAADLLELAPAPPGRG